MVGVGMRVGVGVAVGDGVGTMIVSVIPGTGVMIAIFELLVESHGNRTTNFTFFLAKAVNGIRMETVEITRRIPNAKKTFSLPDIILR